MDDTPTKVVFRQWRSKPHEIIALFPEVPADLDGYTCMSYEHVGQHGAADYEGVMAATWPTNHPRKGEVCELGALAEHWALLQELERIGYVLKPVHRCTPAMRRARFDEARRIREYVPANAERKVSV